MLTCVTVAFPWRVTLWRERFSASHGSRPGHHATSASQQLMRSRLLVFVTVRFQPTALSSGSAHKPQRMNRASKWRGSLTWLEVLPTGALFPPPPLRCVGGSDRDPFAQLAMQQRSGRRRGCKCSQRPVLCPPCQDRQGTILSARPRGQRVVSLETLPGEQRSRHRKV